uniref:Uncharacterized protein n=1 Tax=Anguilla anguilla TaxID=7936 RepID=A0A0E9UU93_ANGAN
MKTQNTSLGNSTTNLISLRFPYSIWYLMVRISN